MTKQKWPNSSHYWTQKHSCRDVWHIVAALSGFISILFATHEAHMFHPKEESLHEVYRRGNQLHLFYSLMIAAAPMARRTRFVSSYILDEPGSSTQLCKIYLLNIIMSLSYKSHTWGSSPQCKTTDTCRHQKGLHAQFNVRAAYWSEQMQNAYNLRFWKAFPRFHFIYLFTSLRLGTESHCDSRSNVIAQRSCQCLVQDSKEVSFWYLMYICRWQDYVFLAFCASQEVAIWWPWQETSSMPVLRRMVEFPSWQLGWLGLSKGFTKLLPLFESFIECISFNGLVTFDRSNFEFQSGTL